jgi:uncharacterized repeat protein (TIGR01451 family)
MITVSRFRILVILFISLLGLAIGPAPLRAQDAAPTNTDLMFHKFVPATLPENNAAARAALQATTNDEKNAAAIQQIQLLMQEKAARTPAQQKIDSNVLYTIRMMRGQEAAPEVTSLYTGVDLDQDNRIVVDIVADVTDQLLQQLQSAGALVLSSHPEYRAIRAIVPPNQIEVIAASTDVSFIGRKMQAITAGSALSRRASASPRTLAFAPGFDQRAARVRKQLTAFLQQRAVTNTAGSINTGQGSVTTEGDATHLAARARGVFGVNGSGLKIGVLSDSANNTGALNAAQATGDMPPTCPGPGGPCLTILQDFFGGNGSDEGTAMMEIIYDMAPGASLFFASAANSEPSFAANIQALRAAGCDIIVDDIFYPDEPVFQDGVIAQAVNTVTASGALYFSSAGNEGNFDAGTAGYFEGDFNDTGSPAFPNGAKTGTVHNFGAGLLGDVILSPGELYVLQWADPFNAPTNDYDLFYVNSAGILLGSSTNTQNGAGGQIAAEFINPPSNAGPGDRLVVFKTTAASPRLFALKTLRGELSVATAGETWGHSAASGAFSVAAAPAAAAIGSGNPAGPFPNPFTTASQLETFTSDGPRRIIFNSDGSPITPGNFSSTGGTVRNKPDITAADGVSTTLPLTSGLNPFFGTSAAAPSAASIAALVKSANPALTPAQIRTTLISTALDIAAPGFDRDAGNGIVMAFSALNSMGLTPAANPEIGVITATENPGNGNGIIEPGEGASLTIQLKNPFGVTNATGITAVLTTITPGVTITQPATSAYPDLPAGTGIGNNITPFKFTVTNAAGCSLNIEFKLTLTYTGGPAATKTLNFNVQTGVYTITNNLGSTPASLPPGVTFATGMQTNRISRNGVALSCGFSKGFPGSILAGQRVFDSYSLTTTQPACVKTLLTSPDGNDLFESVYSPNLVPSSINTNYIGDAGVSGSPQGFSLSTSVSQAVTFVVNDSSPSGTAAGTNYTVQIPSCILVNPATINHVPVVQVHDVTVTAATIGGTANASIDNGSFDPDSGDTITKTQTPPGPYPLGVTNVMLTVVDSKGATAQGTANVTVQNPPEPDLTISSSHFGDFVQGQNGATYTITVTNGGGASTRGTVSVTDTLPSSMTATAISGAGWTCTLGALSCNRSDALAAGVSYSPIILTVNVAGNAPASVSNSVSVSGGGELNTANDSTTDSTSITAPSGADMTVTKTHAGSFVQGQTGTYTITATNSGAGTSAGIVTVADSLPVGLNAATLTGTGWTCSISTLVCTRSDALASGASYPAITLTVAIPFTAPPAATNFVTIAGGGEINSTNNTASDPTIILTPPIIHITKSHVGNFTQGQVGATYTLTLSNAANSSTGAATTGIVTMQEFPPSQLTPLSLSGPGWNCNLNVLFCNRSDVLVPGNSYPPITFTVTVGSNAPALINNSATGTGGGDPNLDSAHTAVDPTTIVGVPDLTITKHHSDPFIIGQTGATFSIVVTNSGAGSTSGIVTVVDAMPNVLTATAISGTGWTCMLASLTCVRSDSLAANSSYPPISLTASVSNNLIPGNDAFNLATVSGGGETNTANDQASDHVIFAGASDLTVSSSHVGNFNLGQIGATYTITVTNIALPQTFGIVTVIDSLPSGLSATFMGGIGWVCNVGTLTCTRLDSILGDGTFYSPITLTVNVSPTAPSSVTNIVTVSGGGEINTANDSASDPTNIIPLGVPDMTVASTHVGNFFPGENFAPYTVTVTNSGGGPTSGTVTAIDTAPPGATVAGIGSTGWTCNFTNVVVTCTRSDALAPGASYPPITVEVNIPSNAPATITNTVTVGGGGETNTSNDTSTDVTTITQPPDLTITKTHSGIFTQGVQGVGSFPTYTITVTNSGNGFSAPGQIVTVVDTLPSSLAATGILGTGWACTLATLTCVEHDQLAPGASYPPITLTVLVASNAPASVTNTARVSGGGEVNTANDTATDVTAITQLADLTIGAAIAPPGFFLKGQTGAQFSFNVTNSGGSPTTAPVTVVGTLPTDLTPTAIAGIGWSCTLATLSCTRADVLPAGQVYPGIVATMNVSANAPASVSTTATVSGGGETIVNNDSVTFITQISTPASVSLSVTSLSFPNQGVNTTSAAKQITVTNTGGQTLTFPGLFATVLSNSTNWTIAPGTTCANGVLVLGGGICIINITFTPTAVGSVGPDTLTLSDNATPSTQTITLTGAGIDFSEGGPTSPVSVTAGQTANFTITLTPAAGGFANAISFFASGLPSASSFGFNPGSLTPGSTATSTTLSISTTARGALPPSNRPRPWTPSPFLLWSLTLAAMLLVLLTYLKSRGQRRYAPATFLSVVFVAAIVVTGCGGGGVGGPPPPTGTPAGTYPITVTATSGSVVHTTTVTLTVQ